MAGTQSGKLGTVQSILCKTDEEVIANHTGVHSRHNAFFETVAIADHYAIAAGTRTDFIETAHMEGYLVPIRSVRVPVFDDNRVLKKISGMGMEWIGNIDQTLSELDNWVAKGKATRLYPTVFAIWENPPCVQSDARLITPED